jgi:hypothetical protein
MPMGAVTAGTSRIPKAFALNSGESRDSLNAPDARAGVYDRMRRDSVSGMGRRSVSFQVEVTGSILDCRVLSKHAVMRPLRSRLS